MYRNTIITSLNYKVNIPAIPPANAVTISKSTSGEKELNIQQTIKIKNDIKPIVNRPNIAPFINLNSVFIICIPF